jgi:hypothetical protein
MFWQHIGSIAEFYEHLFDSNVLSAYLFEIACERAIFVSQTVGRNLGIISLFRSKRSCVLQCFSLPERREFRGRAISSFAKIEGKICYQLIVN